MPAYDFENQKTGETLRIVCSSDDKNTELAKQVETVEDWIQIWKLNMSSAGGRTTVVSRTSDGFRDRLRAIKKANRGSTIRV